MKEISVQAYAKINLGLNILNKREDGYHNLETIIMPISLYDEIHFEKINSNDIIFNCNLKELENNQNLVYKAIELMKNRYDIGGIKVNLIKNIPLEAGLGGGSADCAMTLLSLNKLFNLRIEINDLFELGKSLGADVPACMAGRMVLIEGIGDKLTYIDTEINFFLLIIKPKISFSTGDMYNKFDLTDKSLLKERSDFNAALKVLKENELDLFVKYIYNDFEYAVGDNSIEEIKKELINAGAICSLMTGSGSAVYGIFKTKEETEKAHLKLKDKYQLFMCTNI